ncbi:MAG: hypothetical protein ABH844_04855 [Candidatus Omnitrophota bacterium]
MKNIREHFLVKVIAAVVMSIFLHQQIVWAQGDLSQPAAVSVSVARNNTVERINAKDIVVPYNLGRRAEAYSAQSEETIIHLQDAHASLSAQYSLVNLLDGLANDYDLSFVALEGAEGRIDTDILKNFPDKEIREEAADFFVREGRMSAGEFFQITRDEKNISLYGAEDDELYKKNLERFRQIAEERETLLPMVKAFINQINLLEGKVYSAELLSFIQKSRLHRNGNLSFTDYWNEICHSADQPCHSARQSCYSALDAEATNFIDIPKLIKSIELEKNIDFDKANEERRGLIDELSKKLDKQTLESLVLKSVSFKEERISPASFHDYLIILAEKHNVTVKKYKNLTLFRDYMTIYESVDIFNLYKEIELFETGSREGFYRNNDERELYDAAHMSYMLEKLYNIELSTGDFEFVKANQAKYDAKKISVFLREICLKYNVPIQAGYDIPRMLSGISEAVNFYETAAARDKVMIENTLKQMRREGKKVGALVTGGYHTKGLSELMRENKLSYLVITPKFEKGKDRPYIAILTGRKKAYQKLLDSGEYQIAVQPWGAGSKSELEKIATKEETEFLLSCLSEAHGSGWRAEGVEVRKIGDTILAGNKKGPVFAIAVNPDGKLEGVDITKEHEEIWAKRTGGEARVILKKTNEVGDGQLSEPLLQEIIEQFGEADKVSAKGEKKAREKIARLLRAKTIDTTTKEAEAFIDRVIAILQTNCEPDLNANTAECYNYSVEGGEAMRVKIVPVSKPAVSSKGQNGDNNVETFHRDVSTSEVVNKTTLRNEGFSRIELFFAMAGAGIACLLARGVSPGVLVPIIAGLTGLLVIKKLAEKITLKPLHVGISAVLGGAFLLMISPIVNHTSFLNSKSFSNYAYGQTIKSGKMEEEDIEFLMYDPKSSENKSSYYGQRMKLNQGWENELLYDLRYAKRGNVYTKENVMPDIPFMNGGPVDFTGRLIEVRFKGWEKGKTGKSQEIQIFLKGQGWTNIYSFPLSPNYRGVVFFNPATDDRNVDGFSDLTQVWGFGIKSWEGPAKDLQICEKGIRIVHLEKGKTYAGYHEAKFGGQTIQSFSPSVKALRWDEKSNSFVVEVEVRDGPNKKADRFGKVFVDFDAKKYVGKKVKVKFALSGLAGNGVWVKLVRVDDNGKIIEEIGDEKGYWTMPDQKGEWQEYEFELPKGDLSNVRFLVRYDCFNYPVKGDAMWMKVEPDSEKGQGKGTVETQNLASLQSKGIIIPKLSVISGEADEVSRVGESKDPSTQSLRSFAQDDGKVDLVLKSDGFYWQGKRITVPGANWRVLDQYGYAFGHGLVKPWYVRPIGVASQKHRIEREFKQIQEAGIKKVRVWLLDDGRAVLDKDGHVVAYDEVFKRDVKTFLDLAEKYGVAVEFTFIDYLIAGKPKMVNGVWVQGRREIFTVPIIRKEFVDSFVRPFAKDFGGHPALKIIDLGNELEWLVSPEEGGGWHEITDSEVRDKPVPLEDIVAYLKAASAAIREHAPNVLVTGGFNSVTYPNLYEKIKDTVHYIAGHYYPKFGPRKQLLIKAKATADSLGLQIALEEYPSISMEFDDVLQEARELGFLGADFWNLAASTDDQTSSASRLSKQLKRLKEFVKKHHGLYLWPAAVLFSSIIGPAVFGASIASANGVGGNIIVAKLVTNIVGLFILPGIGLVLLWIFVKYATVEATAEGKNDAQKKEFNVVIGIPGWVYDKIMRNKNNLNIFPDFFGKMKTEGVEIIGLKGDSENDIVRQLNKKTEGKKAVVFILDEDALREIKFISNSRSELLAQGENVVVDKAYVNFSCFDYSFLQLLENLVRTARKDILPLMDEGKRGRTEGLTTKSVKKAFAKMEKITKRQQEEWGKKVKVLTRILPMESLELIDKSAYAIPINKWYGAVVGSDNVSAEVKSFAGRGGMTYAHAQKYISVSAYDLADLRFIANTINELGINSEKASEFIHVRLRNDNVKDIASLERCMKSTGLDGYLDIKNVDIVGEREEMSFGKIMKMVTDRFGMSEDPIRDNQIVVGSTRELVLTDFDKGLLSTERGFSAPLFIQMQGEGIVSQLLLAMLEIVENRDISDNLGQMNSLKESSISGKKGLNVYIFIPNTKAIDFNAMMEDIRRYEADVKTMA